MSMRDFSVGHIKQFIYNGQARRIMVEKVARDYVVWFDLDKGAYRSFRFDKMNYGSIIPSHKLPFSLLKESHDDYAHPSEAVDSRSHPRWEAGCGKV